MSGHCLLFFICLEKAIFFSFFFFFDPCTWFWKDLMKYFGITVWFIIKLHSLLNLWIGIFSSVLANTMMLPTSLFTVGHHYMCIRLLCRSAPVHLPLSVTIFTFFTSTFSPNFLFSLLSLCPIHPICNMGGCILLVLNCAFMF